MEKVLVQFNELANLIGNGAGRVQILNQWQKVKEVAEKALRETPTEKLLDDLANKIPEDVKENLSLMALPVLSSRMLHHVYEKLPTPVQKSIGIEWDLCRTKMARYIYQMEKTSDFPVKTWTPKEWIAHIHECEAKDIFEETIQNNQKWHAVFTGQNSYLESRKALADLIIKCGPKKAFHTKLQDLAKLRDTTEAKLSTFQSAIVEAFATLFTFD